MEDNRPLQAIPDEELLHRLADLMTQSRRAEADIVAHIAEVEERRLYAHESFPSMFAYCMDVLHLSEAEAYLRIRAARASLKHPMLLTMLADGRIHLTAIGKLAPHLTRENRDGLLQRATHRSKRQILELVAEIAPRPDVPPLIRKLPHRRTRPTAYSLVVPSRGGDPMPDLARDVQFELRPDGVAAPQLGVLQEQLGPDGAIAPQHGASPDEAVVSHDISHGHASADGSAVPAPQAVFATSAPRSTVANPAQASVLQPPVLQPLSPGRYKVQFTASAELHDKLQRLRALMSAGAPDADLVSVIELAVTEKLERLEARRFAQTRAPRKGLAETNAETETGPELRFSRHIPAAVRRAVRERDEGRCRYTDARGQRCAERDRLEYHHRRPFGLGGDHSVANVGLLCRAHNAYFAECDYGRTAMDRHRRGHVRASVAPPGS